MSTTPPDGLSSYPPPSEPPYGYPPPSHPPSSYPGPGSWLPSWTPHPVEPIDWTGEVVTAVVGTLFVALAGGVAGLVWDALAPKLSIAAVVAESDAAFRAQIGADAWFLLVAILGGVVCALGLRLVVRRPGPGAAVALGAGGLIAAFVADRVGFLAEHHATVEALQRVGASIDGSVVSQVDFRVRALGVVAAWPLASLAVLAMILGIEALRRR